MGKYRSAPAVVFISGNLVAFKLHYHFKCHQILCPYLALFIFFMPLSRPFSCAVLSHIEWVVWCSSVMMKDDICDKGTDHKLSNHSRNCLLAAPLVALSTLPHVCVTPLECHLNPVQRCWVGRTLVSIHFDGNKSESHCGQRHYKPRLSAIKHLLASLSSAAVEFFFLRIKQKNAKSLVVQ